MLETGEEILICELDPETSTALLSVEVVTDVMGMLKLCNIVTWEALEEAKRGFAKVLQGQIRNPPNAAMLKLDRPTCGRIGSCSSADPRRCKITYSIRKKPSFPRCWEYVGAVDEDSPRHASSELSSVIALAWAEGRHVFIVGWKDGMSLLPALPFDSPLVFPTTRRS